MINKLTTSVSGIFVFLFLINLISRLLGFFREMLFAYYFGTQHEFDVYLVSAVIPITLSTIILYIGQNYFIPAFNSNKNNYEQATQFFKNHIFVFFILGVIVTIILFLAAPIIISIFIEENDFNHFTLAIDIFRILTIILPVSAIISIITAYHQAEMDFVTPAFSRLFLNVTIIPVIIFLYRDAGIYSISIGIVAGTLFQFIYLLLKLKISNKWTVSSYVKDRFEFGKNNFTPILVSIVIIESISQLYSLSDRFFYFSVDSGGISSLNYASNIFMLPISIISVSLSTIIFSKVSEYFSNPSKLDISVYISEFLKVNLTIFLFTTFVFILFGETIVKIIFERGKFSSFDSTATFELLKIYSLSLIFYSTYSLYNKILYSAKLINELLIITIIGVVIKIVFNYLLVSSFKQSGLAISTVTSYLFFFGASNLLIRYKLKIKSNNNYLLTGYYYTVCIILSYLIALSLSILFTTTVFYKNIILLITFTSVYILNLILTKDYMLNYLRKIKESY